MEDFFGILIKGDIVEREREGDERSLNATSIYYSIFITIVHIISVCFYYSILFITAFYLLQYLYRSIFIYYGVFITQGSFPFFFKRVNG